MSTIIVDKIAKSFGTTQAVKDVSFEVRPGEIFGLLGPNGSGKTTSIRVILDIYQPDFGSVTILGGPMTNESFDCDTLLNLHNLHDAFPFHISGRDAHSALGRSRSRLAAHRQHRAAGGHSHYRHPWRC